MTFPIHFAHSLKQNSTFLSPHLFLKHKRTHFSTTIVYYLIQWYTFQYIDVPSPQNDQYRRHDQAVYSLWMHFVTFCGIEGGSLSQENEDFRVTGLYRGFVSSLRIIYIYFSFIQTILFHDFFFQINIEIIKKLLFS